MPERPPLKETLETFVAGILETPHTVLRSTIKLRAGELASKVGASREIATRLIEERCRALDVKIVHDLDEDGRVLSADELAADKTLPLGAQIPKL